MLKRIIKAIACACLLLNCSTIVAADPPIVKTQFLNPPQPQFMMVPAYDAFGRIVGYYYVVQPIPQPWNGLIGSSSPQSVTQASSITVGSGLNSVTSSTCVNGSCSSSTTVTRRRLFNR